jgi:hypothetical protein
VGRATLYGLLAGSDLCDLSHLRLLERDDLRRVDVNKRQRIFLRKQQQLLLSANWLGFGRARRRRRLRVFLTKLRLGPWTDHGGSTAVSGWAGSPTPRAYLLLLTREFTRSNPSIGVLCRRVKTFSVFRPAAMVTLTPHILANLKY